MYEPFILATIFITFLLSGLVKGVIGLGMVALSIGLMTAVTDLPTAMALLLVPSLTTNIWQSLAGGKTLEMVRRIWPFLLMVMATIGIGAMALTRINHAILSAFLGMLLVVYAVTSLNGFRLAIDPRHERWTGAVIGTVNGLLTGMTGSFVVPGVMYLQAIGLTRDQLIQAMGLHFLACTLALGAALQGNDFLTEELAILSMGALVPAAIGMVIGQKFRRHLPEPLFRRIFFVGLLVLGVYIIAKAAIGLG